MLTNPILDKIPLGIIVFDEEKKITYINNCRDCFPHSESGQDYLLEEIKRLVSLTLKQQESLEKVMKICYPKKSRTWRARTEIINSSPYQVMVILQDETTTFQLEETILKAEKLAIMGQLAVGILVEIRNPLTIAKGFCQLIKADEKMKKEYIYLISEELEKINSLIENFTSDTCVSHFCTCRDISNEIESWVRYTPETCSLILVFDTFDNLLINIRKKPMSMIIIKLLNFFYSLVGKNGQMIVHTESPENASYLAFNIRGYSNSTSDIGSISSMKMKSITNLIENNNGKLDIKVMDKNIIDVCLQLPLTKTCS